MAQKNIDPFERCRHLQKNETRIVIGLSGLPGAGKSTLAKRLSEYSEGKLLVLGMDGFHYPKSVLKTFPDPDAALARRGAPWTFDATSFVEKCRLLKQRKPLRWPDFIHGLGDPIEDAIDVPLEVDLILVEGLYVLYREGDWAGLEPCFDETWHLDVSSETAQQRIILRHMETGSLTKEQASQKARSNDLLNGELVSACVHRADYLIKVDDRS